MKRCKSLAALMLALTASGAKAQFVENFNGARLSPGWSFVTWKNASGTYGPELMTDYTVGDGKLVLTSGGGSIYGGSIENLPSISINSGAPSNYDIKVTVQGVYNYPSIEAIAQFGLIIFDSNQSFFAFNTAHSGAANGAAQPYNVNYIDTVLKTNGNYAPGATYNATQYVLDNTFGSYNNNVPAFDASGGTPAIVVGSNNVTYHINKTGTTISLLYTIGSGTEQTLATAQQNDPDAYRAAVYAYLSDLSGKNIGLFNGPGYYSNNSTVVESVTFSKFSTTLPTSGLNPKFEEAFSAETAFSSAFTFNVAANNPVNTQDTSHYSFGKDSLGHGAYLPVMQDGLLWGDAAKNVPNVTIGTGNNSDWYIDCGMYAPFSTTGTYQSIGMVIFDDANNFAMFKDQNAGFLQPGLNYGTYNAPGTQYYSTLLFTGGGTSASNFQDDVIADAFIVGPVNIRIQKISGVLGASDTFDIAFESNAYTYQDDNYHHHYLDNTVTGSQLNLFNYLENINGKHIGLIANPNGPTPAADALSFYDLKTNLNIAQSATVTGTIALEGVNSLTAISAGAPLGTFHISFRTPGTTTEIKGYDVSLNTAAGSPNGTFSVAGVPAGTYDVNIKGTKTLSSTLPGVVVSNTGTVPTVTLAAGDSDNNNVVDTSDFNNLVGVFGNAYSSTQPNSVTGYDPTVDFDFNGVIDTGDFNLLVGEFGNSGS